MVSRIRRHLLRRTACRDGRVTPDSLANCAPGRTAVQRPLGPKHRGAVRWRWARSGQVRPVERRGPRPCGRPRQGRAPGPVAGGMQVRERTARQGGGPLRLDGPAIRVTRLRHRTAGRRPAGPGRSCGQRAS